MGEFLKAFWSDMVFFRTVVLAGLGFAVAYFGADPSWNWQAKFAYAATVSGLVGASSAAPARTKPPGPGSITLVLLVLLFVGCGTTPTDRYYSAVSALAGVRASANAYCEALPQPTRTEQCAPLRPLFVSSDAALEALEAARQDVLQVCAIDTTDPLCKDAGRRLKMAAAGTARLTTELTRWLSARGVKP